MRSIDSYLWLLSFSYSYIMEFTYFMLYCILSIYKAGHTGHCTRLGYSVAVSAQGYQTVVEWHCYH